MSYIGNQSENKVSPAKMQEYVTPNGSATYFDLTHDVAGYGANNLIVVVNNVIQEPASAYTILNDANGRPRRLNFGVALATTDTCYVIYQSTGQIYHTPPANSVGYSQLEANLRSGRVDQFVGSDATNGSTRTTYTLTESALNVNSINVFINGIYQRPTTNYTVSGTALTFDDTGATTKMVKVHLADIVKDAPVPVGGSLKVISGQKLVIESQTANVNDKIFVTSSAATAVDCVASVLQDVS